MQTRSSAVLLAVLVLAAAGCATGAARKGESREVLRLDEIQSAGASNAYDVVQSLRPTWLRRRGQQSISGGGDIVVYHDSARMGGPDAMRAIPIGSVVSIRFFDAAAAHYRWGPGHGYGVILVSSREG